jgi:DNA repair ATPase RecN
LEGFVGRPAHEFRKPGYKEILNGPNKARFAAIHKDVLEYADHVDKTLKGLSEAARLLLARLSDQSAGLKADHDAQELAFRALIEKQQEVMERADQRARMEKARNDLLAKQRALEEAVAQRDRLLAERQTMLQRLTEHRHLRFQTRQQIADRISRRLAPDVRISVAQEGTLGPYSALLEPALKGTRLKSETVKQIAALMWPANLAAFVRRRDAVGLAERARISPPQAEKVVAALRDESRLHALETMELPDLPKIELYDGVYKSTPDLSTGQKCTTILPILMLESERPLIIDEPEKNLDNRFISEAVVKRLREVKSTRQIILVTHNPNIPVLGDAEQVIVMESNGTSSHVKDSGSVDHCRDWIIAILEGGEKAFDERKLRYNR